MKPTKDYTIINSQLKIRNSILDFMYPIKQTFEVDNILIVRIEPPLKIIYNQNVFGINLDDRKVIWQIKLLQLHTGADMQHGFCAKRICAFEDIIKLKYLTS